LGQARFIFPAGQTVSYVPPLRGLTPPHTLPHHFPFTPFRASVVGYAVSSLAGLEFEGKPAPFTKNVKSAAPNIFNSQHIVNSHPKVSILLISQQKVLIVRATDAPLAGWSAHVREFATRSASRSPASRVPRVPPRSIVVCFSRTAVRTALRSASACGASPK
jgi:hypothetical protein